MAILSRNRSSLLSMEPVLLCHTCEVAALAFVEQPDARKNNS